MIKNERQYRIMRSQRDRLQDLEAELRERSADGIDPIVAELELNTVRGELQSITEEIADFEALRSGHGDIGVAHGIEDLPRLLIRARIAAGLTQAGLAKRLGLKPQQVQRYESTDYSSASLERLTEVASALDVELTDGPAGAASTSTSELPDLDALLERLDDSGLSRELVERRILGVMESGPMAVVGLVARISQIFRWRPQDVLSGSVSLRAPAPAFKRAVSSSDAKAAALATWSDYLVTVTLRSTEHLQPVPLPSSGWQWNEELMSAHGTVSLQSVIDSLWSHGIPVLPLSEPGGFHAALFRRGGRDVVVLNHGGSIESLWLFDALHEAGHAVDLPPSQEQTQIESETARHRPDDAAELRANAYAVQVALGPRGPELFAKIMEVAGGDIRSVKRATHLVARREDVHEGLLAFHVAHELTQQGTNWWGAAHNLQPTSEDPWQTVRDTFIAKLDWDSVDDLDRELLNLALRPNPESVPGRELRDE